MKALVIASGESSNTSFFQIVVSLHIGDVKYGVIAFNL